MAIQTMQSCRYAAIEDLKEAAADQTCAAWDNNAEWLDECREGMKSARYRCRELHIPDADVESIIRLQRQESEHNLRWDQKLQDIRESTQPWVGIS
jgi:hypothetical protein